MVSEVNRRWGAVHLIGGTMTIDSVSCASPGNCAAAGTRRKGLYHTQAFVISLARGSWGAPVTVRGPARMGRDQHVVITSVSCGAPGDCGAGGALSDDGRQPFVISEVRGTWGSAIEVPGSPTGSKGFGATMPSLSCGSPANCVAVENYEHGLNVPSQPLLVSQVDGTWRPAIPVPGLGALGAVNADLSAVSCDSAGNCAAGGVYGYSGFGTVAHYQGFVAAEAGGRSGAADQVPGAAALNTAWDSQVLAVSCDPAVGGCPAGGYYSNHPHANSTNHPYDQHAFLTTERRREAVS